MFTLFKRPLHVLSNKLRRRRSPVEWMNEKWIANFSKPEKSCFDIKPEIAFNAYLAQGALFLGLKKHHCMAWLETAQRVYVNQVINARFHLDGSGFYCAAGIMFRVTDRGDYYLVLVSNKGYVRVDVVNNHVPQTLAGWTEVPGLSGSEFNVRIIARNDHSIILLNGTWIMEVYDSSVAGGHLGFALVSYDDGEPDPELRTEYVCQARLDFLSVDSRVRPVETEYRKWNDTMEISAESRFRFAESQAALGRCDTAYDQMLKVWKQREKAVKSVTATCNDIRTKRELLFAARMASRLALYTTAEDYLNTCLAMSADYSEGQHELFAEKVKLLSARRQYGELAIVLPDYLQRLTATAPAVTPAEAGDIPPLYALLGHAYWNLQDYKSAAAAWDTAFSLNSGNGLYAAGAARAYELMGKNSRALERYLAAAACFLTQKEYTELGAVIPGLLAVGKNSRDAHIAAAQWAAGIGDTRRAEAETAAAEKLKIKAARYTIQQAEA